MKKIVLAAVLAAMTVAVLPIVSGSPAQAECKYTSNGGKARWSC